MRQAVALGETSVQVAVTVVVAGGGIVGLCVMRSMYAVC